MKLVEDFSIASESDSDEDSIASSNMAGRERIITVGLPPPAATTRTFRDSRSSSSFNETEVSNRIKKEAEEEVEEQATARQVRRRRRAPTTKNMRSRALR